MKKGNITVTFEMQPIKKILAQKGISPTGDVQKQLTNIVNHRITRYMPYRTGILSGKSKRITSPTTIEVATPYARYQYYGKVMVDPKTGAAGFMTPNGWRSRKGVPKVESDRKLNYDKTKNPMAGPRWDRHLIAAEGRAIVQELQDYVDKREKRS